MMKLLLDTNLLYYWSDVTKSDYSPEKIEKEIRQNGIPYISELSVMEMFVHFREDKKTIVKLLNFIAVENIGIIPFFKPEYTILNKDLQDLIQNDTIFNRVVKNALNKKIVYESEFLSFWLSCIISIIGVYLGLRNELKDQLKSEKFFHQYYALVLSIRESEGYTWELIKKALIGFYEDKVKEEQLKSVINDVFFTNIYILLINYSCAKNNAIFTQLASDSFDLSEENKMKILEDLHNDQLTKNLFKKMSEEDKEKTKRNGKDLIHLKDADILEALNQFKHYLKKDLNNYMIEYFVDIFNYYIVLKDKRINKNDIIDSQLFMQVNNGYDFITVDGDLLKIVKRIDKKRYNWINQILSKCK